MLSPQRAGQAAAVAQPVAAVPSLVPPASVRKPSFYRPELDTLRFGAFLIVFFWHAHPLNAVTYTGFSPLVRAVLFTLTIAQTSGLQLFFLLSAYVITSLLMRERARTGTVAIGSFYARRALRLLPLYLGALLVSYLAARLFTSDHRPGLFLADLLLYGNWSYALHLETTTPLPIYHLWSVPVEEQFYLLFPLLARHASRRTLAIVAVATIVIGLGTLVVIAHQRPEQIWQNSFAQFLFFAAGVLVALRFPTDRLPRWHRRRRLAVAAVGLGIILIAQASAVFTGGLNGQHLALQFVFTYVSRAIGCTAIMLSVLGIERRAPRIVVFLGKLTLGLYIFHVWVLALVYRSQGWLMHPGWRHTLLRDAVTLSLTIVTAVCSYYVLERPFLKWKDHFTTVASRPL